MERPRGEKDGDPCGLTTGSGCGTATVLGRALDDVGGEPSLLGLGGGGVDAVEARRFLPLFGLEPSSSLRRWRRA